MRRILSFDFLVLALLAACVTVNVYFPAAAAEQAADRIIDTVTGQSGAAQTQTPKPPGATSTEPPRSQAAPQANPSVVLAAVAGLIDLVIPTAQAQASPNLDVSSPQIRAITASMQQRFGDLKKYFDAGAVGLTADGQVGLRDQSAVSLADRAAVARLVADDNRDRAALYTEIAKANGHPEWESDIRRTFARRWVERGAQPGWYYQNAGGQWVKK